ncbi:hypothetical protein [Hymenobacter sp. UYCo722]|uniref:hypothetical protein n=1 Tax=Hymenobacter sp. UYCo722 TaxID=3156335 RepID=UPI0033988CCB
MHFHLRRCMAAQVRTRGLDVLDLYLYESALGGTYGETRYMMNKVNTHQLN